MRTLIVTHYFPPEVGAPQARLSELARFWTEAGDEVTVLTGMPNHPTGMIPLEYRGRLRMEELVDGYRVVRTWLYATANEGTMKKTAGHLSFMVTAVALGGKLSGPADVVVASSPTFFSIFSAWVLARLKRARLVVEVRDLWPAIFVELGILRNRWIIGFLEILELWAYGQADVVVVVSEGFRDDLIRRGVPESKIHVIRNGVDLQRFTPNPVGDLVATRSLLGARPGECLVLYMGSHGMSQGLTLVAEAAGKLQGLPIHVAFVGEGAGKAELARTVDQLGLSNVTMLAGVPRDEVMAFLAAADICLVPLRDVALFSSFIPSKIFEYLAAAKAVIGALRGESAMILTEAGAVVVEPGDPDALAEAVRDLAADSGRRQVMGTKGRTHMESNFDRRALAALYRSVLLAPSLMPNEPPDRKRGLEAAQNAHFGERAASWTDRYATSLSFQSRLAAVGDAIEAALAFAQDARVLDYGGGTGVFSTIAARWSSFTLCVDRSEAMLSQGRKCAEAAAQCGSPLGAVTSRLSWLAGDDRCFAIDASPFDLILAIAVLEYVDDVEGLLRSLCRLLGPCGRLLLTVPNQRSALRTTQRHFRAAAIALTSRSGASKRWEDQSYLAIRPHGDMVPWVHAAAVVGLRVDCITPIPLACRGLLSLSRPNLLVTLRHTGSNDA